MRATTTYSAMDCPIATQDIKANLKARDWAFKNVGYGPANPDEPNKEFWMKRADEWNTTVDQAQTMRCANCAAFIQTPEMLDCILKGIDDEEGGYAPDVQQAADLGYCELFDFKCAGDRTCSAWLKGGPITKARRAVDETAFAIVKKQIGRGDE